MAYRVTDAASARLGKLLRESGKKLAVAESCTGGLLAGAITAVPGSSDYFLGGVVAYHNGVKTAALGVPPGLIDSRGAVSAEVASAMAEGVLDRFPADVSIATTGVAGPGGGSRGKPVGTVWVAVALRGGVRYSHRFRFRGDRGKVRRDTVRAAIAAASGLLTGKQGSSA
ncbi:MAG: nicotinamide-nucleotide amidohydrolase family protein [Thermodesulfobacteriota bacterium]